MLMMNPYRRHQARFLAVQAIYQWQMTGEDVQQIEVQFFEGNDMRRVDVPYFQELLHGVPAILEELDQHMTPFLDRPISQVDPVERAILRLSIYELLKRSDVPFKVVINEALELAKTFGAAEGHRYVNGVLDKIAHTLQGTQSPVRSQESEDGGQRSGVEDQDSGNEKQE